MTWTSFFTLLLMNLVGVASPGPDIILVTRYACLLYTSDAADDVIDV